MIELGTRTYLVQHRYDEIHGVFFFFGTEVYCQSLVQSVVKAVVIALLPWLFDLLLFFLVAIPSHGNHSFFLTSISLAIFASNFLCRIHSEAVIRRCFSKWCP